MKYAALALSTLIVGSISFNPPVLAETLIQTQGQLDIGDSQLSDGSFYDNYTFSGRAGQQISIQLSSNDFDTYLILLNSNGQRIAENDDAQSSTLNSSLTMTLPSNGTYTVIANGLDNTSVGAYSLAVLTSSTATTSSVSASSAPPQAMSSSEGSCREAISVVENDLAEGGFYIPWQSDFPNQPMITPDVFIEDNRLPDSYHDYPSNRPQSVTFRLSGDSDRLYRGIMNSPQLLKSYTSQVVTACPRVGLVNFQHWWEGVVPMGYFPDGTIRQFEWVSSTPSESDSTYVRGTDGEFRVLWGYYYSP